MSAPNKNTAPCPCCGKAEFHTAYSGSEGKRMGTTGECFECAFWQLRCERPPPLIIDGWTYSPGSEPADPSRDRRLLGMAGRRFDFQFLDGRGPYTSHNLWCGGQIPERFRDRLPDNARFLNGAEAVEVSPDPNATTRYAFSGSDPRATRFPAYTGGGA